MSLVKVTVIIPTTLEFIRLESLSRAVKSVVDEGVGRPLLVVNGEGFDRGAFDEYTNMSEVDVIYQEEGSLPQAISLGVVNISTDYFSFLDDDDFYLPGAMSSRLSLMEDDSGVDCVVTNGYFSNGLRRYKLMNDIRVCAADPLVSLARVNWMASCSSLFRRSTVGAEYFLSDCKYLEWTATAFLLSLDRRIAFTNECTFQVNCTEGSLSRTDEYSRSISSVLSRLLGYPIPKYAKNIWKEKYGRSLHELSEHYLKSGDFFHAWRCHVKSVFEPKGWRYVTYTRKLIRWRGKA